MNGAVHAVGSDKSEIDSALAQTRRDPATLSVPVSVSVVGSELLIDVAGKENVSAAEVWVYGVASAVPVAVGRGENRGRTVTYHNVARRWLKLGDWNGKPMTWKIQLSQIGAENVDSAAVFVQTGAAGNPGKMLGAAMMRLR